MSIPRRVEDEVKNIPYVDAPSDLDIGSRASGAVSNIEDESIPEFERLVANMLTSVYGNNGSTATDEEKLALQDMARRYPNMFRAIPMLQWDLFKTLAVKNKNYGAGNITMGGDIYNDPQAMQFAMTALSIRLNDKMQRFMNLVRTGEAGTSDETVMDTLLDMSNYALIGAVILTNNWGK